MIIDDKFRDEIDYKNNREGANTITRVCLLNGRRIVSEKYLVGLNGRQKLSRKAYKKLVREIEGQPNF